MRVTDKDRKIYNYIEKVGFATVKQIGNIFFNDIIYKNELAKKRLNCLVEHGHIKEVKSVNCKQHIYYTDDNFKRQTYHNIVVLDIYAEILKMRSVDVLDFKTEKYWAGKTVRSDAYITVRYRGKIQSFVVEVQASKNPWKSTIEKYNNRDVLLDMQNQSGGYVPAMIYADEVYHSNMDQLTNMQVCQVDMNLTDLPLIFDTE